MLTKIRRLDAGEIINGQEMARLPVLLEGFK
jgi:hypothetical protein